MNNQTLRCLLNEVHQHGLLYRQHLQWPPQHESLAQKHTIQVSDLAVEFLEKNLSDTIQVTQKTRP